MLVTQFIGLNVYFGINLLIALVCFGVFWLILDAWTVRRSRSELVKAAGFLLLSLGFLLRATSVQTQAGQLAQMPDTVADILRLAAYAVIAIGQLIDPIVKRPTYGKQTLNNAGILPIVIPGLALPLTAALSGILYFRRATTGLERHLLPVAFGFAGFTCFELLNSLTALQGTANPKLYQFVSTFGTAWWITVTVLAGTAFILGNWVWHYLTKRLQSELFMALVAQALGIFLFTTVGFTFFLLQSNQKQALSDLSTASGVLQYAVTSQQAETAAQAEVVAANSAVIGATAAHDTKALAATLNDFLPGHSLTSLLVVDGSGQVLYRGEDPERLGDSRSNDPLVRRGLIGDAVTSITATRQSTNPVVTLMAVHPIRDAAGNVVGASITGRAISEAFVDGVHKTTGLDSTVYSGDVRAATTLTDQNGVDRSVGITETNTAVTSRVLTDGKPFAGSVNFQNRPYLAAFAPLKDISNVPVGMVLVARPAAMLYAAAYQSIQLIFLLVISLAIISIYPIFRLSRYLSRQLQ